MEKRTILPERAYLRRRRRRGVSLLCMASSFLASPATALQVPWFRRSHERSWVAPPIAPFPVPVGTSLSHRRQRSRMIHGVSSISDAGVATTERQVRKVHVGAQEDIANCTPPNKGVASEKHRKAYPMADPNAPINVVGIDAVFEGLLHRRNGRAEPGAVRNGKTVGSDRSFTVQPLQASTEKFPPVDDLLPLNDESTDDEMFFARAVDPSEQAVPGGPQQPQDGDETSLLPTVRSLWKRRHARSIQEGIRSENTRKQHQLSSLLSKTTRVAPTPSGRHYAARTIRGLINALAEEADGVRVEVDARAETPLWNKHVNSIRINFARLGFKPLRMGGLDEAMRSLESHMSDSHKDIVADSLHELSGVSTADEAFDRIDVDKSGALDQEEIANALNLAAYDMSDAELLEGLASELVDLYDANGDGVVDRDEYQSLVTDMASLRWQEQRKREERQERQLEDENNGIRGALGRAFRSVMYRTSDVTDAVGDESNTVQQQPKNSTDYVDSEDNTGTEVDGTAKDVTSESLVQSIARGAGSILLSDLRLDLRQLFFGMLPILKRLTPGGPLILEPFKATVLGSFNSQDIQESFLLDAGLRRLTARALRRRVRSFRDLTDGAMFFGRNWNMASKHAPKVEIPRLTSVEFDKQNRLVMTGVAQVRYSPGTPVVENKFKVRTKIGTRKNGQSIRLVNPELAFVLECPDSWERNIVSTCNQFNIEIPTRPEPLYSFFPIYSPFKVADDDGFDLGPDNRIKSIYIEDNALRFEMSAVLRPGRFLGSHYLAFTIPQRTFIVTMDKVREGIRTARRNKRAAMAATLDVVSPDRKHKAMSRRSALNQSLSSRQGLQSKKEELKFIEKETSCDPAESKVVAIPSSNGNKSFFSRFVEGYTGVGKEEFERNARLTIAISDWFGQQGANNNGTTAPRRQEV